jgi:prepilin-type N-terminal cleavage/methylation domain-containing protein
MQTRVSNNAIGRRRRRAGFTLTEIMFALGILAYGIAMSAGLFAVAMKYNNQSFRDVVGTIICENGAVVAQTVLKHPLNLAGDSEVLHDVTDRFEAGELTYPADAVNGGSPTSPYGFCVLARQVGDQNDYQLVIVAYKLNKTSNKAVMKSGDATIADLTIEGEKVSEVQGVPNGALPDSPLIRADNGDLSYIDGVDGSRAVLQTRMDEQENPVKVWVLTETGSGVTAPTGMAAYTIRTALPVE